MTEKLVARLCFSRTAIRLHILSCSSVNLLNRMYPIQYLLGAFKVGELNNKTINMAEYHTSQPNELKNSEFARYHY